MLLLLIKAMLHGTDFISNDMGSKDYPGEWDVDRK
jgi:hypothetical protein